MTIPSTHAWATRDDLPVCSRCGVVRRAGIETPCRGSLPAVALRHTDTAPLDHPADCGACDPETPCGECAAAYGKLDAVEGEELAREDER